MNLQGLPVANLYLCWTSFTSSTSTSPPLLKWDVMKPEFHPHLLQTAGPNSCPLRCLLRRKHKSAAVATIIAARVWHNLARTLWLEYRESRVDNLYVRNDYNLIITVNKSECKTCKHLDKTILFLLIMWKSLQLYDRPDMNVIREGLMIREVK